MRAIVQRVSEAAVDVLDQPGGTPTRVGAIAQGLVALVGVTHADVVDERTADEHVRRLANKLAHLRIFSDESGVPNLSVLDISGQILLVSQFTVYADTSKGRRPSYLAAADPEEAGLLIQALAGSLESLGLPVQNGRFGANMQVHLVNDGPMTFLIDT